MPTKKILGAAALAAGLAGGGAAGALLFAPGVSGAQTEEAPAPADEGVADRIGPLETAAEALGMTVDELRTEFEGGASIASVAEARGVDVDTVIDALVEDARARITEGVQREGGFLRGPGGRGHHRHVAFELREALGAAAESLGITEDELRTALREDGQTLAEVAAAEGVDVQVVIDAIVAEVGEEHRDLVTAFVNEGPRFERDGD